MAFILLVEDDPSVARLLRLTFELDGHTTEVLTDGTQASDRLAGPAPDLLVLDIMLPAVDGLQLLRRLRRLPSWTDCPVIVLSAQATDDAVWEGWKSGASYYLTKPFKTNHLRDTVDALLTGRQLDTSPTGVPQIEHP